MTSSGRFMHSRRAVGVDTCWGIVEGVSAFGICIVKPKYPNNATRRT